MSQIAPPEPVLPYSQRLNVFKTPRSWLYAFWKFSRPHTIIGTSLSVWGLFSIAWAALGEAPLPLTTGLPVVALAWAACLAGNVYIVGLNQLEDVEIDRVNKPHLPLASGEFSRRDGLWIVGSLGCLALLLAGLGGVWLLALVGLSLIIGTAYSLPPLRLKRFPFWASFCILAVRGAVVNLGLFLHYSQKLGLPLAVPPRIWALTGFILIFSIAIAFFKDIPDIEGDRRYNIRTLSVELGQRAVFNLARTILTVCYLGMAIAAPWLSGINRPFVIVTHLAVLALFWLMSFRVAGFEVGIKPKQPMAYPAFYQFIWKLFFLEYVMFPLACWLA